MAEGYRKEFEERKVFRINAFELDDKVLTPEFPHWKHGFFAAFKNAGNDTCIEVDVEPGGMLDFCDQEALDKFVATGEEMADYGLPDILLNDLCRRGLIDPGRYLIEVSW